MGRAEFRVGFDSGGRRALALPVAILLAAGCASKASAPRTPAPPADGLSKPSTNAAADRLGRTLEQCRTGLESTRAENTRLREQVRIAQQESAAAEERFVALQREMDRALDDVLASKASLRGVNNRALAISRIAEVRVQMQSAVGHDQPEAAARLRGGEALLARADRALTEGNYGGAAYLADRAGELIRQARTVAEVAARQPAETAGLIPIVPARTVEVAVNANLRRGPGVDRPRVGTAKPGERLLAVGRLGEWFEIAREGGGTAWIHRTTIR